MNMFFTGYLLGSTPMSNGHRQSEVDTVYQQMTDKQRQELKRDIFRSTERTFHSSLDHKQVHTSKRNARLLAWMHRHGFGTPVDHDKANEIDPDTRMQRESISRVDFLLCFLALTILASIGVWMIYYAFGTGTSEDIQFEYDAGHDFVVGCSGDPLLNQQGTCSY